jgi:gliding motility-associated-like protein/uncharacterized repeat protein (TIGR01451 family)
VFPSTSTVYTVTGTNSGCNNTATVAVTVNTLIVNMVANPTSICSGQSATLTASGANSFTWSPGNSNSNPLIINPAVTTVYTITGTSAAGCTNTAQYTMVVNPTPVVSVVSSATSICVGQSATLAATGATSYSWNPGSAAGGTYSVTPTVTTIYTVTGTTGSCSNTNTVAIVVSSLPVVSASTTFTNLCNGGSSTLTASGASTYTWLPLNVSGSSVSVNPSSSTQYTVTGTDAAGCNNATTITISVTPVPTVQVASSHSAICIGNTATLTASGATNYTWMPGPITGVAVVGPTITTTYTVTGNSGSPCSDTETITVVVNQLPTVLAVAAPTAICAGSNVTLTAGGAINFTWSPGSSNNSIFVDVPPSNTTYTVLGEDANGCTNQMTVSVLVNPTPTVSAIPSNSAICAGATVTLTASGAATYSWAPTGVISPQLTDAPAVNTTYTVYGVDANGCEGSAMVSISVVPVPVLTITASHVSVCIGNSATLTASGASNYTWFPSNTNNSVTVESPLTATNYTLMGDNAGLCFATHTVDLFVNPLPANVTASSTGTISCASPSAVLTGATTDTNVSYAWSGPQSYTSAVQNPTVTSLWGDFTLTVTDNVTGCSTTNTTTVFTDHSIPLVNATASGSITCASPVVTITATHTTTNPAYAWTGPNSFTSSTQSSTVNAAGQYTIIVLDQSSGCSDTTMVAVNIHTLVPLTASITAPTCSAGISLNNGSIQIINTFGTEAFDIVVGNTYTGTATYTNATPIPTSGILTSTLANPSTTVAYTLRLFDAQGCTKDTVLYIVPVDCALNIIGIANAASSPALNADGSYKVNYTLVVKNYDTQPLTEVTISNDLRKTYSASSTFTIDSVRVSDPLNSGIQLDPAFDGKDFSNITSTLSSLAAGKTETITVHLNVRTGLFFTPFENTALVRATSSLNVTVRDSSTTGFDPDPDNDLVPGNNSQATVVSFTPTVFFGITKKGSFVKADNNTFDLTYTVTVHNLGNDTVRNVILKDSLLGAVIRDPASFSIRTAPNGNNGLVGNNNYNGSSDVHLVVPGLSKLAPQTIAQVVFVVNIVPDTVTVINNSAFGQGMVSTGPGQTGPVTDISNDGSNPDANNNNVWNEPSDNVPTPLILPSTIELFIPEGFSPNGDGINDQFVIKGLPNTGENTITIFNRWGNRVYFHQNYGNGLPWDGSSNIAGTAGQGKLPQGTYYYVLEMKGNANKTITGYIILQY